ncbi:MAG TPA: amidohydrolase family protein, partial [Bryobacteraceae bacterium]|nr:amidohydrolase family protein [Bryobacteraceae bacterium]
ILKSLRAGDIVTHCFQGRGDGILENGSLIPEAEAAKAGGIVFDVGHGCGSFHWDTAKSAFEHFFYPDTISTDLHRLSVDRFCISMPTTMSKFLHLGMSLEDVILKTTWTPARVLGRDSEIGTLRPGAHADLFAFSLEEGEFPLEDTHMKTVSARRRIKPELVMKAGSWIEQSSCPETLRPLHDSDREILDALGDTA